MTQNNISVTESTLFVNQNKKTLYFTAFNTAVETFLTYSLGEHENKLPPERSYKICPLVSYNLLIFVVAVNNSSIS